MFSVEIDSIVLRKIEELREILEEEEREMENKAAEKHAPAKLGSYKSGIAVIKSNFNIEPGALVGEYRNGDVIELGFIIDKKERMEGSLYIVNTYSIDKESIPEKFEIAKAEFLYALKERIKILDKAEKIISKFDFPSIYEHPPKKHNYLDEYESEAVNASLNLQNRQMLLVFGPPGTGKTTFVAEAARILGRKEKVFVTAQTHQSVDNIFIRLKNIIEEKLKMPKFYQNYILRIGSHIKISEEVKEFSPEYKYLANILDHEDEDQIAEAYAKGLNNVKKEQYKVLHNRNFLVGATVTKSITNPLKNQRFDTVFIDEAHNMCLSLALLALERASKAVITGDYYQIPPVYKTLNDLNKRAEYSTFNFFYELLQNELKNLIWLRKHYRCNEKIINFSSKYVYEKNITVAEECKNTKLKIKAYTQPWLNPEKPIVFINNEGTEKEDEEERSKSKYNIEEVTTVTRIAEDLIKAGIKPTQIIVLTPFVSQAKKIRNKLKNIANIKVRTVHSYLGGEKDVVIFSTVATSPSTLNFLDKRFINVVVTRAVKKLIIIGSVKTIKEKPNSLIYALYNYIKEEEKKPEKEIPPIPKEEKVKRFCPYCGYPIPEIARFCPYCGAYLEE